MIRLLLFDLDGVLNTLAARHGADFGRRHNCARLIDPECVRAFNHAVDTTGAKLVVSSSWRNLIHQGHMDLLGFGAMLRSHGIHGELIGATPDNPDDEPRWMQIQEWLRGQWHNPEYQEPFGLCVLDDDPDAFGPLPYPGVQTSSAVGMTMADAEAVIGILGVADGN